MPTDKATLTLTLDLGMGRIYTISEPMDSLCRSGRGLDDIEPIGPLDGATMNTAIEVMRDRNYRRDTFMSECRRMGGLLADTMEDAEGWHDPRRVEPAKRRLRGETRTETRTSAHPACCGLCHPDLRCFHDGDCQIYRQPPGQ